ncbi:hypothetical protein JCM19294_1255 [Nonlabens tegetincola]|uniref:Uncharacterized protein n=1 Tax=Nonlabens tegetincola TaxID=323273 RepID=A0A090Q297_9FLAO|nr:hypothetical protein JCM19294_1255 [Nonlabens tegetincola]
MVIRLTVKSTKNIGIGSRIEMKKGIKTPKVTEKTMTQKI